jgi:hypothetical protein
MFDKLLHAKLLAQGLEGQGVITAQKVEGGKGRNAVMGAYVGIQGHIKFDDGTEAQFSSLGLDTSKLGDLDVGTIVPVRYDADHKHAVLDVPKLEAAKKAESEAAAERLEARKSEKVTTADAAIARRTGGDNNDQRAEAQPPVDSRDRSWSQAETDLLAEVDAQTEGKGS